MVKVNTFIHIKTVEGNLQNTRSHWFFLCLETEAYLYQNIFRTTTEYKYHKYPSPVHLIYENLPTWFVVLPVVLSARGMPAENEEKHVKTDAWTNNERQQTNAIMISLITSYQTGDTTISFQIQNNLIKYAEYSFYLQSKERNWSPKSSAFKHSSNYLDIRHFNEYS